MLTSSFQQHEVFAGRYRLVERLGSGGSAEVWRVFNTQAGIEQALKIYEGVGAEGIPIFRREFSRVFNLRHQNLLRASDFSVEQGTPYLIMPYCQRGSLRSVVGELDEKKLSKLLHDIGSALAYLHGPPFHMVHQDVKPANILIGDDGDYLLADFGISTGLDNETGKFRQSTAIFGETPKAYRAPEFFGEGENLEAVFTTDVWALGTAVYEAATGSPPFGDLGGAALLMEDVNIPWPEGFSSKFKIIVNRCLSLDPWNRPSAAELSRWSKMFLDTGSWPELKFISAPDELTLETHTKDPFATIASVPTFGHSSRQYNNKNGSNSSGFIAKINLPIAFTILSFVLVLGGIIWWSSLSEQQMSNFPIPATSVDSTKRTLGTDRTENSPDELSRQLRDAIKPAPIDTSEQE